MQIDVAAGSHVARHHAADQPGTMTGQEPHDAERFQPHLAEVAGALAAFVQASEGLNLVPNFGVTGQIGRLHPAVANAVRGLLLRAVILRLLARVHQSGGLPSNLPPELALLHRWPPKAQSSGTRA